MENSNQHDDDLTTIKIGGDTKEIGFRIPPPPEMTEAEWRETAAGFVGDYRPIEERRADPRGR